MKIRELTNHWRKNKPKYYPFLPLIGVVLAPWREVFHQDTGLNKWYIFLVSLIFQIAFMMGFMYCLLMLNKYLNPYENFIY